MKNTGGPAFPTPSGWNHEGKWVQDSCDFNGMTLRDYFAAKAMPIAATFYDTSDEVCNEAAAWCYKMADAMLKAREE